LINQPIAATAARYQVANILPLREWKDGAVVLSGLKVNDQELKDVPMLVADLDCECDVVLGRRWVEEFGQGWLEEPEPRMSPEEVITPSHELQEDLAVRESRIDGVPECSSRGDDKSEDYFDDRQVISAGQEDFCSSRTPIAESQCIRPILRLPRMDSRPYGLDGRLSVGNPEPPTTTSKDRIVVDEGVVARLTVRFPGQRNKEDLSAPREELDEPLDELSEEDACRSRTPITDDQCIRPLVRFPESDRRFLKPKNINSPSRVPEPPAVTTRKNWITIGETVVVRLSGCGQHGYEETASQKEDGYASDSKKASQKDDGHCSDSENVPKNLILGESPRVVGLNDLCLETTDVVDGSGRGKEVKALIEVANQPPNQRPIDAPSFCTKYETRQLSDWTKIPDTTNNFQRWNNEPAVVSDAGGEPTAKRGWDPRLRTLCFNVFLDPAYGSAWIDTGQPFRLTMPPINKLKDEPHLLSYYWHTSNTFSDPVNYFVKSDQISGCRDKFLMKLSTSYGAHNWSIWFLQISSPAGLLGVFINRDRIYQLATWVGFECSFAGKEVFMKSAISLMAITMIPMNLYPMVIIRHGRALDCNCRQCLGTPR
jgi:hypothetical protein